MKKMKKDEERIRLPDAEFMERRILLKSMKKSGLYMKEKIKKYK